MNEHSDRTVGTLVTSPVLDGTTDVTRGSEPGAPAFPRWNDPCPRWLAVSLIVATALVFVVWLSLAAAHVDDRYQLDHVSGARMALAQAFDAGTLYPELYDGDSYGGTRFMPIPIVLHGLTAEVTGEYLVSGKLLGYASTLLLLGVMVAALRGLRCPVYLASSLAALVLTNATGFAGSMNMRADTLPLALQVMAVWIVARTDRPPATARPAATVGAAVLAALALGSKLSAVWAPIAIVIWLSRRDRRRMVTFAAAYAVVAVTLVLVFAGVSDGRMFENVLGLSASGITGLRSIALAPYRLMHLLVAEAGAAWALVPLAGLAAWMAFRERWWSIYLVSLLCASVVVVVVLTDVGTGGNQLIDLVVLTALVIGELVGRVRRGDAGIGDEATRVVGIVVGLGLLWATISGFTVTLAPAVEMTVRGEATYAKEPLSGLATSDTSVLSEDPYVPISLDQVPVVLDPFMLPRLAERRPDAIPDLVERIDEQEFDLVVLMEPLEPLDRQWWNELDLGASVVDALSRSYSFAGKVQGYYVYEPTPRAPSP